MHRKTLFTVVAIIFAITCFGKHDGGFIRDLTMSFKTAHLEWASKLKDGKINTLFIVARKGGRDVVEVAQRMELGMNGVTTFNALKLAVEDMYESAIEGTTEYEKKQELLKKLGKKYDLYVLGNFSFNSLPSEAQFKVLRQVLNGSGLVFVYPRKTRFEKIFSKPINAEKDILSLVAKIGLPSKISNLSDSVLLKTYQFGKGRIAVIDYCANHGAYYSGQALSVPNMYSERWQAEFENNMVLVMRTMKWAAGRKPAVKISCPALADSPILKQKAQNIDLDLKSDTAFKGEIEFRLRNEFDKIIKNERLACDFKGDLKQAFNIPFLSAGKYYLDVLVTHQGKTDNFGYFAFNINSPVKPLIAMSEVIKHHGPIKADLKFNKVVNASVEVTLSDSPYGRIWFKKIYKLSSKQLHLNINDYYMPTIAGYIKCAVKQNGNTLAVAEKMLFFPNYKLENYLELAWSLVQGTHLGRIEAQQVVDKLGWRAGLTHPSKDGLNARYAALLNQRFVPYTTRISLRKGKNGEVKQHKWFFLPPEERAAQKALNGDESFCRPEVKELWAKGIKHRIKNLSKYGPAIYTLGDENSLAITAGYGKSDKKGFRDFVKQKYGTITNLNKEWGSAYKAFSAVKHYPLKEAKEKKIYAAWFDHQQYMEEMYADMHHFLAKEIKKYDPDAKVGAEGSVPGDLEKTIKGLEFWGPYSNLVMDEVLRSIGGDKIRMLWWGGYVGSHGGRSKYPTQLWKDLLTGNVNGSAWYEASKATSSGVMGADMDLAHYVKVLLPYMLKIQNGLGQLLNTVPLKNDGIAILWSHASDSARLLESKFINPRGSMGYLIRFCYRNALNFDFLTKTRLAKLNNYKVLFLFGASALSQKESSAILEFVSNGGTVIADLNPGILNENLRIMKANQLEKLFGAVTYKSTKEPKLAPLKLNLRFKNKDLSLKAAKANTIVGLKPFTIKPYGKGEAILLNFDFPSVDATCSKNASLDKFMLNLLAELKVKSSVKISGINKKGSIIRVRENKYCTLIGILTDKYEIGKKVTINMDHKKYLYAPGEGFIKYAKSISVNLNQPFKLLACFNEPQEKPQLNLSAQSVKPGEALYLNLLKFKQGTVLLVQIRNPKGKMLTLRKKVIIIDKESKNYAINFAFNDLGGEYTVILTDVASGLKSEKQIKLTK